jgi:hypothetical protein
MVYDLFEIKDNMIKDEVVKKEVLSFDDDFFNKNSGLTFQEFAQVLTDELKNLKKEVNEFKIKTGKIFIN